MINNGFTLPELLCAIAVASILMLSSSALSPLLAKTHLHSDASDLISALRYARTKAVLSQEGITILSINGDWQNGWQVFIDPNRNAQLDAGEVVLLQRNKPLRSAIRGNRPVADYIHYSAQGSPELISGGFQAGTVLLCTDKLTTSGYKIILSKAGRTRLDKASLADCTGT